MKLNGEGHRGERPAGSGGGGASLEAADTEGIHYNGPLTNHRPLVDERKHLHHSVVKPRREVCLALK